MLTWASSKRKKWVSPRIPVQGILRAYYFLEDGHREVHFLYSLTKGITQNSFGVECARLAGLPDRTLHVAVQRSTYSAEMERLRLRTRRYGESSHFRFGGLHAILGDTRLRNALRAARVLLAKKDGTNQGPGQLRELLDQLKL